MYIFGPNCRGGVNLQILGKKQVHDPKETLNFKKS